MYTDPFPKKQHTHKPLLIFLSGITKTPTVSLFLLGQQNKYEEGDDIEDAKRTMLFPPALLGNISDTGIKIYIY